MKKMPTLFIREFTNNKKTIKNQVHEGCEWVLEGKGIATKKFDGTCCLIKDGKIYARYDLKPGRKLPENAIPCQEKADEVTGHFPHWVLVENQPEYKWHRLAFENQPGLEDGTYELCGPHFQRNPENLEVDTLFKHGSVVLDNVPRDFEGLKKYLEDNYIEGIVFHRGNGEMCKIKRSDFGFEWNVPK